MSWSLALIQPNREFAVSRALVRWKFPHHVFKVRRRVVHRGHAFDRLFPAFPGYIFVAAGGLWSALRERCAAITEFVRTDGGRVAILPDATVTSLLAASDAGGVLPTPEFASPRFRLGDRVIYRGEKIKWLNGHAATYERLLAENSAQIVIDWMGRPVPISVDERDLVALVEVKHNSSSRRKKRRHRRRPPKHLRQELTTA